MNREETLKIMAVLRGAYPNFYRDMTHASAEGIVGLWQEMFTAEPYDLVAAAVKALIATDAKGFPPHIGAVKAWIQQIAHPEEMTEAEAWALVSQAVRNTDWLNPEKQFTSLPPAIQAAVGSPHTLVEWGKLPEDTFASVAASHFHRVYRAKQASARSNAALPQDIKAVAAQLSRALALEGEGVHA